MNKLTKEERTKIADLWGDKSCDQMIEWVEQKKKQWREVVFMEVKDWTLKQPDEGGTSFYDYHKALLRFLDDKVLKSIKHN